MNALSPEGPAGGRDIVDALKCSPPNLEPG